MSTISDSKKAYESGSLARTLKKSPERKPEFTTSSGIPLDRVYVPDEAPVDYERQLVHFGLNKPTAQATRALPW